MTAVTAQIARTAVPTDLSDLRQPAAQAFRTLQLGFVVAPIVAGVDKFFNLLTDWTQYVAPIFPATIGVSSQTFMHAAGVVEVVAGLLVALKPRYAGYVVSLWLFGIILNLLILGQFMDVALRDLGLAIGAFALARLADAHARASEQTVHIARSPETVDTASVRKAA